MGRMVAPTTRGLRQALAAVLIIALTLTGVGRAVASVPSQVEAVSLVAGVAVPICHSGRGAPTDPAAPVQHDCCDACALMAVLAGPAPTLLSMPAQVEHHADHARAVAWVPAVARLRSPRQSRAPPTV